jgi:hypothetical protein
MCEVNDMRDTDYLYIPENEFDIDPGQYYMDELAEMLRNLRFQPDKIYFIADMIEEGSYK